MLLSLFFNKMRFALLYLYLILGFLSPLAWADQPLPTLNDSNAPALSELQEATLGKQFFQSILASGQVVTDPLSQEYMDSLGQRLVKAAQTHGQTFHFFIVASPEINAFAGPGGYIGVNAGLIANAKNESEVAAVLAHEISHVTQGHLARSMTKMKGVELSTLAGMLASIAIGAYNPSAAAGAMSATMASAQANLLHFSRGNEEEADRIGMQVLYQANFDPKSMPDFFATLEQNQRLYGEVPEFLSSHPLTNNRIADSENRASSFPKKTYYEDPGFYFFKNRLNAQTASNTHLLVETYEKQLPKLTGEIREASLYGYALALKRDGQAGKGLPLLAQLKEEDPNNLWIGIAQARSLAEDNRMKEALTAFSVLNTEHPGDYAIVYFYSYTLLENNQPKQALTLLRQHQLDAPDDPIPYELLSQAQGKSGLISDAYQTRAAYLVSMGAPRQALDQLKMAAVLPNNSDLNKAKIAAQMAEIQVSLQK